MNRRFGKTPDPKLTYRTRPGVYAIIRTGEGILASFQENPTPELQLPGGGIDEGETTLQALYREVIEETGYRIHSPRRLGMFHRYTFMPDYGFHAHKLCHVYLADIGPRLSDPTEEGHTAVFLDWEEALTRLAVSGDRFFVSQLLDGRFSNRPL